MCIQITNPGQPNVLNCCLQERSVLPRISVHTNLKTYFSLTPNLWMNLKEMDAATTTTTTTTTSILSMLKEEKHLFGIHPNRHCWVLLLPFCFICFVRFGQKKEDDDNKAFWSSCLGPIVLAAAFCFLTTANRSYKLLIMRNSHN